MSTHTSSSLGNYLSRKSIPALEIYQIFDRGPGCIKTQDLRCFLLKTFWTIAKTVEVNIVFQSSGFSTVSEVIEFRGFEIQKWIIASGLLQEIAVVIWIVLFSWLDPNHISSFLSVVLSSVVSLFLVLVIFYCKRFSVDLFVQHFGVIELCVWYD